MKISLIAALDQHGGIGHHGQVPWRISSDMKRFKALTMGHHLVMGRKTWESIGKPLQGRTLIIVTRQRDYQAEKCLVVHSLDAALALAHAQGADEVFIIGGGELYREALHQVDRMYLTFVNAVVPADTFFPEYFSEEWIVVDEKIRDAGENDEYATQYKVLERRGGATGE